MATRWQGWMTAVFLAASVAACGGGDDSTLSTAGVATIGTAGGVVRGEGGAQVVFPPDALTTDVTVRIAKDGTGAPPLPPVASAAGAVYMITPHGGGLRSHAQVSIPVTLTDLGPTEQMVMVTAQPGDVQWTVLSGATYANGEMSAPVMHFSFFQVVTLRNVSMPSLVSTLSVDHVGRSNNVGGAGVGRFVPGFEFDRYSLVQNYAPRVEAKLTYPAPAVEQGALAFTPPQPQPCLPVSYGHTGTTWRFVRNGTENVTPAVEHNPLKNLTDTQYPRFESEITGSRSGYLGGGSMFESSGFRVPGMGAMHVFGQDQPRRGAYAPAGGTDVWATPPAGNSPYNDVLTWGGAVDFLAEPHNGHIRVDVTIATSCNLLVEAVPLSFRLFLARRDDFVNRVNEY